MFKNYKFKNVDFFKYKNYFNKKHIAIPLLFTHKLSIYWEKGAYTYVAG